MYMFFMGAIPLPVPPSKLEIKTKSRNKTIDLLNDGEVSVVKEGGLAEISFTALLPRFKLPFSSPVHLDPSVYLTLFELLKSEKQVFQFIVVRTLPNYLPLKPTNIKCTLEDFTVIEDAGNGLDVTVNITLKQYKEAGLKTVKLIENIATALSVAGSAMATASVLIPRSKETAPKNTTYTVKKGDTLYNISKKELGDGARWKEIYNLNKDKIENPDLIYPDQKLTLPN